MSLSFVWIALSAVLLISAAFGLLRFKDPMICLHVCGKISSMMVVLLVILNLTDHYSLSLMIKSTMMVALVYFTSIYATHIIANHIHQSNKEFSKT